MKYESITDIYSANENIREMLAATLNDISPDEAAALPDGEKWSIRQIVEHLSMVEFGTSRICAKLLDAAKASGKPSDGSFALNQNFGKRAAEIAGLKVEAPERVRPTGNVTIPESIERMKANRQDFDAMRTDFEKLDFSGHTFPHPFFGDLTAGEWLVMAGLHEQRHIKQIKGLLAKIRQ